MSNYWSLYAGTEIPANADMHDYMTPGNYYHPNSATAKTLVNCPLTNAFQLKVTAPIENSAGDYILQEYTEYNGQSVIKVHYDQYSKKWRDPVVYATKSDFNSVSNKLMLAGMQTLSVKWTNSDTLEFYVDNTRVFGILAKWGGNYS